MGSTKFFIKINSCEIGKGLFKSSFLGALNLVLRQFILKKKKRFIQILLEIGIMQLNLTLVNVHWPPTWWSISIKAFKLPKLKQLVEISWTYVHPFENGKSDPIHYNLNSNWTATMALKSLLDAEFLLLGKPVGFNNLIFKKQSRRPTVKPRKLY